MNVTVRLSRALSRAVNGRHELELGVPDQAGLGDILQSLFALYPKLQDHFSRDDEVSSKSLGVVLSRASSGRTLYVFSHQALRSN